MFPTDVIAQERIADRLRESESERLGRRLRHRGLAIQPRQRPN